MLKPLAEATGWRDNRGHDLSLSERTFIEASVADQEAEEREAEVARMLALEQAQALAREQRQRAEQQRAYKRILARDLAALRTQPPEAMSAMDGYAVRAADATRGGARLKVIGEVAAGRPFDRVVGPSEAVRIFTGGVVPDGADAVIIQEDTRTGSIGESIAAIIQEEAFEFLDAPIRIIGALDTPVPYSPPLEEEFLASEAEIEEAARQLIAY